MIGTPRVHHRVADSTNRRARELAAAGAPHGTLVTADEQTAGRGRHGRSWVAPPGSSVLMSLVVRGLDERSSLLPLVAAVAVVEACESVAGVRCRIKWPNDVWIERRKVAGILVEGRPAEGWAVLGIGLNVATEPEQFPPELRDLATSLRAAALRRRSTRSSARSSRRSTSAYATIPQRCWTPGAPATPCAVSGFAGRAARAWPRNRRLRLSPGRDERRRARARRRRGAPPALVT